MTIISPVAVDVHAHFRPRSYRDALNRAGVHRLKIDVYETLARLHYDVAGAPLPHALPGLLAITSADQLL